MTEQKPYDPSDEEQVEARGKQRKWTQAQQDLWLSDQLKRYEGRRYFWGLLSDMGVFNNPFHQSNAQTAFNCGMQNAGQRVLADITRAAPEQYVIMMREAKEYK